MSHCTQEGTKDAITPSDAHLVPETEKKEMDNKETTKHLFEENKCPTTLSESLDVAKVADIKPPSEQISTKGVDLAVEDEKKDAVVVQEQSLLQPTENVEDVPSPAEKAPSVNQKDAAKGQETEIKRSTNKEHSDGSDPIAEKTASCGPTFKILFVVLLFALGAGAALNFLVFNTADTNIISSFLNDTDADGSSGPSSTVVTNSPTITRRPSRTPSLAPSIIPTISGVPTISSAPTKEPSSQPSIQPTLSTPPTSEPSSRPSSYPTISESPTKEPTNQPSIRPSIRPSAEPSKTPTRRPSLHPTVSDAPSNGPSSRPSTHPTVSDAPTNLPTIQPSSRPTMTPSDIPTVSQSPTKSPTESPTPSPTATPTNPPTQEFMTRLRSYLEDDVGVRIASSKANQAFTQLLEEAAEDGVLQLTPKLVQRYAMINMEVALFDSSESGTWGRFKQDECSWTGIKCNGNREVTDIRLLGKGLQGSIPSEVGLLQALTQLDAASNNLRGSIPEELYNCLALENVYLYQNKLSGTISDKIISLWNLKDFNLSSNRISGRIPSTMRSTGRGIYRIHTFSVYDNQMTGTVPLEGSRLRQLFYLDLGRNEFRGTIPASLAEEFVRLRYLYLDFNKFSGTLPSNIVNAGDGRLNALAVNDNRFTGHLPGNHMFITELMQITAQNNQFTSMNDRTCQLSVLNSGELTEFKSDCGICDCGKNDQMCKHCYN